ncbi:MAG TPA: cytochrome c-type biogenesis protein CcmH [Terriglobales bacterium]|nr:cytochrome c-type biogenesis protein CcmH [Terriglobales bacterium]
MATIFARRGRARLVFAAALALTLLGAGDSDPARFSRVGKRLMCPCGCAQMLLECNHVGCPDSDSMRAQLGAGIAHGDTDDAILAGFVATYGATVLAAPTRKGFDLLAWIMPFVALGGGIIMVVYFVRRWQLRNLQPAFAAPRVTGAGFEEFRRRAREETEL